MTNTNEVAKNQAKDLLQFINSSPSAFHASAQIKAKLIATGFVQLSEKEGWQLNSGGKYFVERNDSAIIAFVCGDRLPWESGLHLIGAHTDSPALKIKSQAEFNKGCYTSVRVEVYGSPIVSTWLDRELTIAGRVIVRSAGKPQTKLVNFARPIAIVPNLAIHMNREVNKGFEYNPHTHLAALLSADTSQEKPGKILASMIARELNTSAEDILDADLVLADTAPGQLTGANEELIVAGRLDDLAMCHAILSALTNAKTAHAHTNLALFFDNEEVGSHTLQGADSTFLSDVVERLVCAFGGQREDYFKTLARSFLISADMAHALHPNFSEKHDDAYAPVLNGGPVVKQNANFRYATTAESTAFFEDLCKACEVPVQRMINRADVPCGSTIGPMTSARMSIPTVDVGNPMMAMHSIRETTGVLDHLRMTQVFTRFFSS